MASFSRKTGIIGALVIAGVLIAGSYILSSPNPSFLLSFLNPNTANAESTTLLLQEYAARNHDGLPDWEAELYGLDPNNIHSFSPTTTNAEAVAEGLIKPKFLTETPSSIAPASTLPGQPAADNSLTDQFSQTLMSQFLTESASSPDGTAPSDEDIATLAENAMQTFAQNQEHQDAYTQSQVQVSGSGPDALRAYAAAMDQTLAKTNQSPEGTENEIDYFSDAVERNDTSALAKVALIGKSYSALAPAMMQLQVPTEAQYAHLEIANAASRIGADITDMSTMESDPLRAYLGLAQYQADATSLANAFADMGSVFSGESITLSEGNTGYYFYKVASQTANISTAAATSTDTSN